MLNPGSDSSWGHLIVFSVEYGTFFPVSFTSNNFEFVAGYFRLHCETMNSVKFRVFFIFLAP